MQELREHAEFRETFKRGGWREELATFYRMRRSVVFVFAVMVALSAFWTNPWAFTAFFGSLALYAAYAGVRMGFVCATSFAIWFLLLNEHVVHPGSAENRAVGLWCIATLFLLVVWKADGVHRLRDRREAANGDSR